MIAPNRPDCVTFFLLAGMVFCPSCKSFSTKNSDLLVFQGTEITDSTYSAVAQLISPAQCTATFVSKTTMITAAHCVFPSQGHVSVKLAQGTELQAEDKNVFVHPDFRPVIMPWPRNDQAYYQQLMTAGRSDVAVVVFPHPISDTFHTMLDRPPLPGEKVTIVGFGGTEPEGSDYGIKRKGCNQIKELTEGMIHFTARPLSNGAAGGLCESGAIPGDSGGPLFIDDQLAGISSWASPAQGGIIKDGLHHSFYCDLSSREIRAFLKYTVIKGAKIDGI